MEKVIDEICAKIDYVDKEFWSFGFRKYKHNHN